MLNLLNKKFFLIALIALASCTSIKNRQVEKSFSKSEPIQKEIVEEEKLAQPVATRSVNFNQCSNPATEVRQQTPFYLDQYKTFITAFTNHCSGSSIAVENNSDWAAMRVPCTETAGEIDVRGNSTSEPKQVSFSLDVGCGFIPKNKDQFEKQINHALGLSNNATSLAINPLSVQYWEVLDSKDADIGHVVMLRTYESLDKYKKNVIFNTNKDKESIFVNVYGRENAWGTEQNFYHYLLEFRLLSNNRFIVNVKKAQLLSADQKEDVAARCQALQPKRNCHLVF